MLYTDSKCSIKALAVSKSVEVNSDVSVTRENLLQRDFLCRWAYLKNFLIE